MSQTFILCELGMNHSRVVFPKGGCTTMLGNSNSWTVWQTKQFTISKQMMWWGCCSIISKKKVCRAEISSGKPHCWWTWHRMHTGGEKKSSLIELAILLSHKRIEDVNIMGFSPWLFHEFVWRLLGFSRVFSFPEILYQCSNNVSTLSPNAGMMVLQSYVPTGRSTPSVGDGHVIPLSNRESV